MIEDSKILFQTCQRLHQVDKIITRESRWENMVNVYKACKNFIRNVCNEKLLSTPKASAEMHVLLPLCIVQPSKLKIMLNKGNLTSKSINIYCGGSKCNATQL